MPEAEQKNPELIKTMQKFTRFHRLGKINFEEYALCIPTHLVGKSFLNVSESLSDLSKEELTALVDYCHDYIVEHDYSPHPQAFLVDRNDPIAVENMRIKMRPKFKALLNHLQKLKECFSTEGDVDPNFRTTA